MTCIAWKGNILAADTQLSDGSDIKTYCRKLHPIKGHGCLSVAGNVDAEWHFTQWFIAGAKTPEYPYDRAKKMEAIYVTDWGDVHWYTGGGPDYLVVAHPFHAIGSGGKFAMALMHEGYTAAEAVEAVGEIEINCNSLVDTYNIKTQKLTLSKFPQLKKRKI